MSYSLNINIEIMEYQQHEAFPNNTPNIFFKKHDIIRTQNHEVMKIGIILMSYFQT